MSEATNTTNPPSNRCANHCEHASWLLAQRDDRLVCTARIDAGSGGSVECGHVCVPSSPPEQAPPERIWLPSTTYKTKRKLSDEERWRWRKVLMEYRFNNCDHENESMPRELTCIECAFECFAALSAASSPESAPTTSSSETWAEAATIVEACLNVHSTFSDAEREFAAHLIEVFKTRDQHPDYKHRNTQSNAATATPTSSSESVRAAAEEVVRAAHGVEQDCLARTCFVRQCEWDHCAGCEDFEAAVMALIPIITKHLGGVSGGPVERHDQAALVWTVVFDIVSAYGHEASRSFIKRLEAARDAAGYGPVGGEAKDA